MTNSKRESERWVLLLLVEGFAEVEAALYIGELRQAGLPLKTVGLTKRPVRSKHGVEIVPDLSLDEVIRSCLETRLLILPGGRRGLGRWRMDPRTRSLWKRLCDQKGSLVTTGANVDAIQNAAGSDVSFSPSPGLPVAHSDVAPSIPVWVAPGDIQTLLTTFVPKLVEMCLA